jgi:hypothetical protein
VIGAIVWDEDNELRCNINAAVDVTLPGSANDR